MGASRAAMDHANLPGDGVGRNDLKRDLRGWQIFFIVASVIIGQGVFSGDRSVLDATGPGGLLLGLVLVGALSICVMECVSEFVQLFPIPNAIVEYIRAFVDEDLAWCCGIAYWYTWASVFAALYLVAAKFADFWYIQQTWSNIFFFIVAPIAMLIINMMGVRIFGYVETVGGVLKLLILFGTGIVMYHLYDINPDKSNTPLYDGLQSDPAQTNGKGGAVFWGIPRLAYTIIGSESVAVTAFEARDIRSLRVPSQVMAYVIVLLYAFVLIGQLLIVRGSPNDPNIGINMPVQAARDANMKGLADFLNGCYIFCVLSGSNSALYIASRTLYGLARNIQATNPVSRFFKRLSKTTPKTGVPALALFVSAISFFWLPFLSNIPGDDAVDKVILVLETTSSSMCLIVWASLCAAFLRYRRWMFLCRDSMPEEYRAYDRTSMEYGARTAIMFLQPGVAWVGFMGSLVVTIILSTATWWNGDTKGAQFGLNFALAYAGPLIFLFVWIGRKAVLWSRRRAGGAYPNQRQGWVVVSANPEALAMALDELKWATPAEGERRRDGWIRRQRDKLKRRHEKTEQTPPAKELHDLRPPVPAVHLPGHDRDHFTSSDRTAHDSDEIERIG